MTKHIIYDEIPQKYQSYQKQDSDYAGLSKYSGTKTYTGFGRAWRLLKGIVKGTIHLFSFKFFFKSEKISKLFKGTISKEFYVPKKSGETASQTTARVKTKNPENLKETSNITQPKQLFNFQKRSELDLLSIGTICLRTQFETDSHCFDAEVARVREPKHFKSNFHIVAKPENPREEFFILFQTGKENIPLNWKYAKTYLMPYPETDYSNWTYKTITIEEENNQKILYIHKSDGTKKQVGEFKTTGDQDQDKNLVKETLKNINWAEIGPTL